MLNNSRQVIPHAQTTTFGEHEIKILIDKRTRSIKYNITIQCSKNYQGKSCRPSVLYNSNDVKKAAITIVRRMSSSTLIAPLDDKKKQWQAGFKLASPIIKS